MRASWKANQRVERPMVICRVSNLTRFEVLDRTLEIGRSGLLNLFLDRGSIEGHQGQGSLVCQVTDHPNIRPGATRSY